jgi:hypothetical protein
MARGPSTRIRRGLYEYRGYFIVSTEKLGTDKKVDWVAIDQYKTNTQTARKECERILHGGVPSEYDFAHNTLRDAKNHIDRELDRV